ncbi:MAG TPA: ATP-binding protein [Anaeromyxobacteraceae bacterium]|nr:ATP-binding protein [Anaeromyxobacteraceae bacterium]
MSRAGKATPLPAALARGAIDSIGDPVLLVGPDGGVVHLNPAAEELFDRSRDRAVGLPVRALPGGAPLESLADRVRRAQEATQGDFATPRDPSEPLRVEATPLFDGASCVGTVLVIRARRNGERHLDFEALAAGLAHEIKNPLAGLQGSAELLAREAEGAAREYARVIAREARRVDGLVRELLDLARPATLQAGPVNVHSVLRDVMLIAKGLPGGDRVLFTQHFDPSLPHILGDQEKLTQVVLNLLRNAVEAVRDRPGPEVVMETGVAAVRLRQSSGRSVPLARVAILDNGAGIPESMLGRLFTPFATSKAQGTGLGLAISRRIVEAHGGRIEVRNRPSGGAEAALFLPLASG